MDGPGREVYQLKADLMRDEELRLEPYLDSAGNLTIGVGRNLSSRGITEQEAHVLLDTDVAVVFEDLDRNVTWWRRLPDGAQRALANMCFNLGWPRLSGFRRMLLALQVGDFETAAREALDSKWARQVGDRAVRIAELIRKGNTSC